MILIFRLKAVSDRLLLTTRLCIRIMTQTVVTKHMRSKNVPKLVILAQHCPFEALAVLINEAG